MRTDNTTEVGSRRRNEDQSASLATPHRGQDGRRDKEGRPQVHHDRLVEQRKIDILELSPARYARIVTRIPT